MGDPPTPEERVEELLDRQLHVVIDQVGAAADEIETLDELVDSLRASDLFKGGEKPQVGDDAIDTGREELDRLAEQLDALERFAGERDDDPSAGGKDGGVDDHPPGEPAGDERGKYGDDSPDSGPPHPGGEPGGSSKPGVEPDSERPDTDDDGRPDDEREP